MLVRDGLREILHLHEGLSVVGEAHDSHGAVLEAAHKRPDVVLIDLDVPGAGIAATVRHLRQASPRSEVIVLAMRDDARLLRELLPLGIRGYLLKNANRDALVSAIRGACHDDGSVVFTVSGHSLSQVHPTHAAELTSRQIEVLELTADALTNGQIAARLGLSEATVKRHLRNINSRLGAVSRMDAVNRAIKASLINGRRLQ